MALDPKTLKSIISAHISKATKEHQNWDRYRAWYRSEFWGEVSSDKDDPLLMENNYLYAFTDTMVASVTPPTPRVTCIPRRKDEETGIAAKYQEALINDVLYRIKAHELLWKLSTHASIYSRGIIKAVWSFTKNRPDFVVIDPRYFFFDMTAARWGDIRYAIEVTTLTKAEFSSRTKTRKKKRAQSMQYDPAVARKAQMGTFPRWLKDSETGQSSQSEEIRNVFEWVVVYEVYDFTTGTYYHMLENEEEPLFQGDLPYVFVENPFSMLAFNDNLSDIGGMSDSQLVERQQRRLNELDTLELRHAQSSIPVTVINEAMCDDPEEFMDQVSTATSPGDVVRLKGKNAAPLGDILGNTPTSSLTPDFSAIRDRVEATIQFVLGIPEYARGVAGTAEVATELALVDAAMRTRLGRRTKLINAVVHHMATSVIGLYEEFLDSETEIPARVSGRREALVVSRGRLSARDPEVAEQIKASGGNVEEPLEVDYEIVPFSPTENSKSAQLKKIQQFADLILSSPFVNPQKFMEHLFDVLDIGTDVLLSEEEIQAQQQAQAQAVADVPPVAAEAGATPEDVIATGGMPEGVSEVPVGAMGAMAGGSGFPSSSPGEL